MQHLQDIGRLGQIEIRSEEEKAKYNNLLNLVMGNAVRDSSQDPLGPAFNLSWFYRMWTVQEVTLPAIENVVVQFGAVSFPWIFLLIAVSFLKTTKYRWGNWDEATHLQRTISGMFMERRTPGSSELFDATSSNVLPYHGILQILASMRPKKATDPKDKVFALFGVAKELHLDLPPPDYEKSLEQIYVETAVASIENDKSLNIIYEAPSKIRSSRLPSWVPDWSDENWRSSDLRKYVLEKGTEGPSWSFSQDYQRLIVSGKLVDSIHTHGTILEPEDRDFNSDFIKFGIGKKDFKDVLKGIQHGVEILKRWVYISSLYSTYPTGEPVDGAFRNTLLDGGFVGTQDRHPSDDSFTAWSNFMRTDEADVLKSLLTNSQTGDSQFAEKSRLADNERVTKRETLSTEWQSFLALTTTSASEYHFAVLRQARGKCFFSTSNGYFGLAIGKVQPGDQIAFVAGLEVPLILRETNSGHLLVTYSYIHGMMTGDHWQRHGKVQNITLV
jgi:hypothetical protein